MNVYANINGNTAHRKQSKSKHTPGRVVSPRDHVTLIFDQTGKRKDVAIAALIDAAEHSAALSEFLIQEGAKAVIGEQIRSDNAKIFRDDIEATVRPTTASRSILKDPGMVSKAHQKRLKDRASSVLRLLDAQLPNGTLMTDAKSADIEHAISVYEPQARNMWQKANYFKTVLRDLPQGKTVGEVFDDEALTALYRTAAAV